MENITNNSDAEFNIDPDHGYPKVDFDKDYIISPKQTSDEADPQLNGLDEIKHIASQLEIEIDKAALIEIAFKNSGENYQSENYRNSAERIFQLSNLLTERVKGFNSGIKIIYGPVDEL